MVQPNVTPLKLGARSHNVKAPPDERLGFEACVVALGLKANVSEAEHPLLCEGTRRQRGDLALAMMVHYKDDQMKLGKVSASRMFCIVSVCAFKPHLSILHF